MNNIQDIKGFEEYAQRILPESINAFFSSGAGSEITLEENTSAFDDIKLLPRVLKNEGERSLTTKILNQNIDFPLLIAPMAFQRLAHPDGEIATIKAAREHNIIAVLSTCSTCSFEEICVNSSIPLWFQLYIYKDRKITENLIRIAEVSGCKAIVLTVDAPVYGKRKKELNNPIVLNADFEIKNLENAGLNIKDIPLSQLTKYLSSLLDPTITWNDISWVRSITSLPIILKGIINPEDLKIAIDYSVDAVIVSNHGGRQLDTTLPSIDALKLIRDTVKGEVDIILDGGVRRGVDILKALALGAKAVMVGRPILWGLATGGEDGVKQVLNILKDELDLAMALSGYSTVNQINEEIIFFPYK